MILTPAMETSPPPSSQTTSPAKALQEIVSKQLSGRLTIREPNADSIFWRVYVSKGQVHFATSTTGQQERLTYLLQQHYPHLVPLQLSASESDYQHLCHYWQSNQLSLQQVRKLLFSVAQEALVQLLALPQAVFQFERTIGLDPLLLSAPLKEIILPVREHITQWAHLRADISSPFQRPFIIKSEQLPLVVKAENPQQIQLLHQALNQNLCLYEIACQLKISTLDLTKLLQPLARAGTIGLNHYIKQKKDNRPIIACIDDSKTVQRNVRLTLESSGYQVLELMEPAKALTALVRQKPVLVLMDITMPELDGYELCYLLRQSHLLKNIPIVMLTGRDGLIDRIRARMVGATDYMTKPFEPQQLLSLVQKLTTL